MIIAAAVLTAAAAIRAYSIDYVVVAAWFRIGVVVVRAATMIIAVVIWLAVVSMGAISVVDVAASERATVFTVVAAVTVSV